MLVCRLVGMLAKRLGQPQVVGEMIAGVMLGPSLFGLLAPGAQAALFPKQTMDVLYVFAQFGVGMYMFLVGTDFSQRSLSRALSQRDERVAGGHRGAVPAGVCHVPMVDQRGRPVLGKRPS